MIAIDTDDAEQLRMNLVFALGVIEWAMGNGFKGVETEDAEGNKYRITGAAIHFLVGSVIQALGGPDPLVSMKEVSGIGEDAPPTPPL